METVTKIAARESYDKVLAHLKALISEATALGALDDPEADNEYTQEIGRLGRLCADYESEHIAFKHIILKNREEDENKGH
jgi:hypothetical protein